MVTRIISWNVNGIRAVQRKGFLDWFNKEQPDILCVQETKAHPEQLDEDIKNPAGYHSYFSSAQKKGYSGVATFTQKEPQNVSYDFAGQDHHDEGRIVVTEYKEFILINVYFPNGKASPERLAYKMQFYEDTLKYLKTLKKPHIITGDVNTAHTEIDLARPKDNEKISGFLPEERAWIDTLVAAGYTDTFRHLHKEGDNYTWWSMRTRARERNVGWRIDYFFVSNDLLPKLKSASILSDVMGSDHCPIDIVLDL